MLLFFVSGGLLGGRRSASFENILSIIKLFKYYTNIVELYFYDLKV